MPKKGERVSEETRQRMREAAKNRPRRISVYNNVTSEYVQAQFAEGKFWCSDCKGFRDAIEFGNAKRKTRCKLCQNKRGKASRGPHNRAERSAKRKEYYHRNIEKSRAYRRMAHKRRFYGVTPEMYAEQLALQNGVCAICGGIDEKALAVDHNHTCCPGKKSCGDCRRGLLCYRCNTAIGRIEEFPDWPERARAYLAAYGG